MPEEVIKPKEQPIQHSFEIVEREGVYGIEIELGDKTLHLPIQFTQLEDGTKIAYFLFDPREEDVKEAGAEALAELVGNDVLWVTVGSVKSGPMVEEAHKKVHGDDGSELIVLDRAKETDEKWLDREKYAKISRRYKTITGSEQKELGVTPEQLEIVAKAEKVAVVDDIFGTGATSYETIGLINPEGDKDIQIYAVAEEKMMTDAEFDGVTVTGSLPPSERDDVHTAVTISSLEGSVVDQIAEAVGYEFTAEELI